jgi:hypothetical protein
MHVLTSPIGFVHSPQGWLAGWPARPLPPATQQTSNPDPACTTCTAMNTLSVRAFIPPLTRRCVPLHATRRYAVQAPGAPTLEIFSNQHKWQQKERAASNAELSRSVDYLRDEVASRLCERVLVRLPPRRRTQPTNTRARRTSIATSPRSSISAPTPAT